MLHRFVASSQQSRAHDPRELRATLALLRKSGVRIASIEEAIEEYVRNQGRRTAGPPTVAFTVDDGYQDFMDVGLPVFESFDCPVTCFVVPDVVDGKSWFWWDRLDFVLRRLPFDQLIVQVDGERFDVPRSTNEYSWKRPLVTLLKGRSESFRSRFLAELEAKAGVAFPSAIPNEYRVMTWDAIRECERRGVRFGAHSLTHPVLSQVSDDMSRDEILGSVRRLQSEVDNPSSVFCYPYGLAADFGAREIETLQQIGVEFAVSALPGVVRPGQPGGRFDTDLAWRIPRFAFDGRAAMALRQLLLS
ncbi:MAG: polysaccharide deacetylase family protein [Gemmatimonadaceae bacterium]|nr:polysaccharide deacetylase family protein [Gemmatimonadaceae bacterium]